MNVLYEDNHIIIVNKASGEIVQGDKTGDTPLVETVRAYIKEKYNKPGNVFCGLTHRLDRPVSGVVIFAKTSKALERINNMLQKHEIKKTYWAIVQSPPSAPQGRLENYLWRNEKQNKSYAYPQPRNGAKESRLRYRLVHPTINYFLVEVELLTGRHHQIRCQLSTIGSVIKGDLKYGARRSNRDGGISLHAYSVSFIHPVKKERVEVIAHHPLYE